MACWLSSYEGQKPGRTSGLQAGQPCESRGIAGSRDDQQADADLYARGFAPRTQASTRGKSPGELPDCRRVSRVKAAGLLGLGMTNRLTPTCMPGVLPHEPKPVRGAKARANFRIAGGSAV